MIAVSWSGYQSAERTVRPSPEQIARAEVEARYIARDAARQVILHRICRQLAVSPIGRIGHQVWQHICAGKDEDAILAFFRPLV
jgi:hypothetical protein